MHSSFSNHSSIIRRTALALLGLCFVQLPARAHTPPLIAQAASANAAQSSAAGAGGNDSIWLDIASPVMGIVPGQTLSVCVLNPLAPAPPGEDGRKYKMLFAPLILYAWHTKMWSRC